MRTYLRGKVSRRLILQFVLAALIPMSGVAWYAYHQVSTLLLNSAYEHLRADSKSFGMAVIESLNTHASALKQLAQAGVGNAQAVTRSGFTGTSLQPLAALTVEQRTRLGHGGVVLRLASGSPVELVAPSASPGTALVGEIETASLWTNDFSPERYCVLDADLAVLFCTPGLVPPDRQMLYSVLGTGTGGTVRWSHAGEDLLVGLWRPKFLPAFESPGFVIMQVASRADALRTLNNFRHFFPITFLLALILAAALAIRQVQRQMKPLNLLTDASQRLAAGDLGARIELAGNDEFTELGETFNDMAGNLEYRFHMLAMLSELDRAIISASGMEQLASEVLRHVRKAIPCDGAGLLVPSGEQGHYLLTCDPGHAAGCVRTSTRKIDLTRLSPTQPATILPPDSLPHEFLDRLCPAPPAQLMAFPIRHGDRLGHVLLLAHAKRPAPTDDIVQGGRALADRLGIALSSLAQEEKLHHQAHHDSLTDLPNRVLLRQRCEQAIDRAQREQTSVALILIDLDNFKQVNDTLGHAAGDELLLQCATNLRKRLHQDDTLARLGGDEFVLLLQGLANGEERTVLDERLRALMSDLSVPITVHEYRINTPASMGVALYPAHAGHFNELLQMADAAMYKAKREQRGGFQFYSNELNTQSKARFDLTQELRRAVQNDELVLHFQPKVDARTREIVGAEALVRWLSPTRGLVSPGVFVHLLDEMGLGVWLGEWVLDRACAQMREWQDSGQVSISVSVNMSPAQFERTSILEVVRASLERYQLDASCLEIEILEATAVNDSDKARQTLVALRAEGIRVALDDFGTGYSSLVYLTRIPADVLKLDQAFIRSLPDDPRQQEIVRHIIALAKTLSYTVVGEGVEDEAQLSVLVAMGCDLVQGYLIGRPVPADEFAGRWLR
ncbi:putative bifunctional diguanylate cyclase/phosphodiesterase [Rhodanobacter ginsenosidimutans]|uniref:Bifunctional diguanylate cyclase/phosphodiesterase n=1 Tax=Rhodanobacter ginsenosidimutans TaxID=490571 RepID=A0ABW0JS25_9GAMM